jgi:hypothetical protein
MSFELFLSCYRDGEPAGIEEGRLRDVFGDALVREEPEFRCWRLEYGSELNGCDIFVTRLESDPNQVKALMVSRPVEEARLWDALYRIMRLGDVILFFPGGAAPLFADAGAVRHFPREMLDALGHPVIIEEGADILALIQAA